MDPKEAEKFPGQIVFNAEDDTHYRQFLRPRLAALWRSSDTSYLQPSSPLPRRSNLLSR